MKKQEQANVAYEVVQTSRAFEEVMAQLRRLVLQGHLKAGDRLPSERDLAIKLGVSRNTIREALRGLEMAGVLELHKGAHGGAFLIMPNGDTVSSALQDMFQLGSVTPAQLTEARLHMTAPIVRVACERIREEDLLELERSVEEAKRANRDGDHALRSRLNLDFNRILARTTQNPVFVAIMNGLIAMMEHFVDTIGPPQGTAVFTSRARLIGHLRARDADAATAEMEKHLKSIHKDYLSRLELHTVQVAEQQQAAPAPRTRAAKR
jgi:GntR family transcriptional repressor for pyruvate dehydrogenase complex